MLLNVSCLTSNAPYLLDIATSLYVMSVSPTQEVCTNGAYYRIMVSGKSNPRVVLGICCHDHRIMDGVSPPAIFYMVSLPPFVLIQ